MYTINYEAIREATAQGRYLTNVVIDLFLDRWDGRSLVQEIGVSVAGKTIKSLRMGTGPTRILMWSQMHGNEATTTKAVLDLINFLHSDAPLAKTILERCCLMVAPILNPDGAEAYTRTNANGVDLNRDAQERTQPESRALWKLYNEFGPHYCFNLHDQRTIYNVGETEKPATVSFLSPASDPERSISVSRKKGMQLIAAMNAELQNLIPGQVGRYDDGFNSNCIGDAFQMLHTPTVLFEAGHFPGDYQREQTRFYLFTALLKGIGVIAEDRVGDYAPELYFDIPQNNSLYYDILIKNIHELFPQYAIGNSAGILFAETLVGGQVQFSGKLEAVGDLHGKWGHKTYDCLKKADLESLKGDQYLLKVFE